MNCVLTSVHVLKLAAAALRLAKILAKMAFSEMPVVLWNLKRIHKTAISKSVQVKHVYCSFFKKNVINNSGWKLFIILQFFNCALILEPVRKLAAPALKLARIAVKMAYLEMLGALWNQKPIRKNAMLKTVLVCCFLLLSGLMVTKLFVVRQRRRS